jgi:hypothetical protein
LSSSSCSSIELHKEADTIDSESVDEQSRSPSPDLPEQPAKDGYALEYTKEPEQLLAAPIPTKGGKKKTEKKKKGLPTNFPSNPLVRLLRNESRLMKGIGSVFGFPHQKATLLLEM